jgi:hypothetical protein
MTSADLAAILSAIAAWLALAFSIYGVYAARKALRISEIQEERQKPDLVPYLVQSSYCFDEDDKNRIYAFLISISNRSDSNNAIARADLTITYETSSHALMSVKIDTDVSVGSSFPVDTDVPFRLPVRIDAHQTLSGWLFFRADRSIFHGHDIVGRRIVFSDTHGVEQALEIYLVKEIERETVEV